jgi:hypothetical protein
VRICGLYNTELLVLARICLSTRLLEQMVITILSSNTPARYHRIQLTALLTCSVDERQYDLPIFMAFPLPIVHRTVVT